VSFKRLRASWIHDRYMRIQFFSNLFIALRTARINVFILPYVSLRVCTISFDTRSTSVKASWQIEHGDTRATTGG
jgi:hypothetical protein